MELTVFSDTLFFVVCGAGLSVLGDSFALFPHWQTSFEVLPPEPLPCQHPASSVVLKEFVASVLTLWPIRRLAAGSEVQICELPSFKLLPVSDHP